MPPLDSIPKRAIFGRLSVVAANILQLGGSGLACLALAAARPSASKPAAIAAMISAWILLYFFCHGIAHWFVGRLVGIRFAFYTVGGTGNPEAYPGILRWVFERLPFFGVQTEKVSMQASSPAASIPSSPTAEPSAPGVGASMPGGGEVSFAVRRTAAGMGFIAEENILETKA